MYTEWRTWISKDCVVRLLSRFEAQPVWTCAMANLSLLEVMSFTCHQGISHQNHAILFQEKKLKSNLNQPFFINNLNGLDQLVKAFTIFLQAKFFINLYRTIPCVSKFVEVRLRVAIEWGAPKKDGS